MNLLTLGAGLDLTASAAAETALDTIETPFARGFKAVATIHFTGATGTPVVKVQTSDDGTNWTDVLVTSGVTRFLWKAEFDLKKKVRVNRTAAGTAGTCSAWIET